MSLVRAGVLLLVSLTGCDAARPLIAVQRTAIPEGTRLTLIAAPGARVNARLKPALELADGRVLRFDGTDLTPDSSYYTSPAELQVSEPLPRGGVIRASVCPAEQAVCRQVTIALP